VADFEDTEVYLGSRDEARGRGAVEDIVKKVPGASGRLHALALDVDDEASIRAAAETVGSLDALCNNAGIGFGHGFDKTLRTNFDGTVKTCDAFLPRLSEGGRIVNIASASGPNFVSRCGNERHRRALARPDEITLDDLFAVADEYRGVTDYEGEAYGVSKACVNAYTYLLAKANPGLLVNSVTPGYIMTDLTRGMGATGTPEKGARIPVFLLTDTDDVPHRPTGRFHGSDGLRSPLDRYREPGSPPYDGPPF